jgi:hypothetical protein
MARRGEAVMTRTGSYGYREVGFGVAVSDRIEQVWRGLVRQHCLGELCSEKVWDKRRFL